MAKEDQFIRTWGPPETKQNKTKQTKPPDIKLEKEKYWPLKCQEELPLSESPGKTKKMTVGEINEKEQKQINEMINLK